MTQQSGLICGTRHRSYENIEGRSTQVAAGLGHLGIVAGDVIAILMRNDIAVFEAPYVAQAIGVYAVPINWHLTSGGIDHILKDSKAWVLITHVDLLRYITRSVSDGVTVLTVPTTLDLVAAYNLHSAEVEPIQGYLIWDTWLESFQPLVAPHPQVMETMMYTFGTTDLQKGVKRAPQSAEASVKLAATRDKVYGIKSGIRALVAGPLF